MAEPANPAPANPASRSSAARQSAPAGSPAAGGAPAPELWIGTSGYSFDGWKDVFYPPKLKAAERLRFYASRLPAVEINATFYQMPKTAVLEGWRGDVPERFRFAIKASQRITHKGRLKDVGDSVAYLLGQLPALEQKLGCVLFQLPPNLKKDIDRLAAFLALLPRGLASAFEFRHASWFGDDVYALLRDAGAALVWAEDDDDPEPTPLVSTASWGYLRLRKSSYDDAALAAWAGRIRASGWERAYAFLKHDEGEAPARAARLLELASGG